MKRPAVLLLAFAAACSAPGYREPGESEGVRKSIEDENIATRVRMALADDPQTAPYDTILVSCRDGVVVLAGSVDRSRVRGRAVRIAQQTPGVVRVVDNMEP
jgi:osmotically-inducible protein OsmY